MQEIGCQGVELPTTENEDETVQKFKNTRNVCAWICVHLDMSYMQHILNTTYLFASNK